MGDIKDKQLLRPRAPTGPGAIFKKSLFEATAHFVK